MNQKGRFICANKLSERKRAIRTQSIAQKGVVRSSGRVCSLTIYEGSRFCLAIWNVPKGESRGQEGAYFGIIKKNTIILRLGELLGVECGLRLPCTERQAKVTPVR
jgi:hypothetical protein